MTEHPITPSPELVQEWSLDCPLDDPFNRELYVATQAARWGADQELEACANWVNENFHPLTLEQFLAERRPKPPSLKWEALALVEQHEDGWRPSPKDWDTIRRALEALPDV